VIRYRRRSGEAERETGALTPDPRGYVACSVTGIEFQIALYSDDEDCTLDGLEAEGDFGRRRLTDWVTA
jgi:hypothetical protein